MSDTARTIAAWMDETLSVATIRDYPEAWNGLQVDSAGPVTKIAAAVDASKTSICAAIAASANLLVVHHGLLWDGNGPWIGPRYRKLAALIRADLAVYSAHLPLDAHPELGNNVLLAKALGFAETEPGFVRDGTPLGRIADHPISRAHLQARIGQAVSGRVHLCPGGPAECRRIGIVTGGAGTDVARAAAAGCDTFITGEGPHHTFALAEELGVNLFYAGHYATETFGVKALAAAASERFGVPWVFLDHPSGL